MSNMNHNLYIDLKSDENFNKVDHFRTPPPWLVLGIRLVYLGSTV